MLFEFTMDVTAVGVRTPREPMIWQPVAGAAAALILIIVLVAIGFYIYRRSQRIGCKVCTQSSPNNGKNGQWIPPSQSIKQFDILKCVTTHIIDGRRRKDSSFEDDDDNEGDDDAVYPRNPSPDSPIGLTSATLVPAKVQPTSLSRTLEKRQAFVLSKQRHGSRSSSPLDSSSKASDEDEADDAPGVNGKIWFRAKYIPEGGLLSVEVIKAKYLKGRSIFYSPRDPFVRVYLLPDESNYFQTKVKHRTFSPKFKETFQFKLEADDASSRSLKFVIYDFDKRSVRHSLGQVTVPLAKLDIALGDVTCCDLDDSVQCPVFIGEMLLGLFCNPFTDKFKATVIRLRNLPMKGIEKNMDVYIKADLYHGRHQAKSKTSLMHPMEANVEIQEAFSFGVSGKFLDSCSLMLTVVRRIRGSPQDDLTIGQMVVGPFMFARGRALLHWQEMLANSRTNVEKWHNLNEVT